MKTSYIGLIKPTTMGRWHWRPRLRVTSRIDVDVRIGCTSSRSDPQGCSRRHLTAGMADNGMSMGSYVAKSRDWRRVTSEKKNQSFLPGERTWTRCIHYIHACMSILMWCVLINQNDVWSFSNVEVVAHGVYMPTASRRRSIKRCE